MRREEGQSTIEFLLTLLMVLGFLMFFLQSTVTGAFGSYVQYATFMAARAYQSAGPTYDDQLERGQDVLRYMIKKRNNPNEDRWPALGRGEGDGSPGGSPKGAQIGPGSQFDTAQPTKDFSWMDGVRYTFKSRLFFGLLGGDYDRGMLTFTSESWLTREISYEECLEVVRAKEGIIDNGC